MGQFRQQPGVNSWTEEVTVELERVCNGEAFRHSKQSARLLRYLVEHSLSGNEEALRERAIGVSLFGRETKYDTNEDSIVRVSAAEVRKRLARHYAEAGEAGPVRLTIPTGSYRVEFQRTGGQPAQAAVKQANWWWLGAAAVVLAAVGASVWAWPKSKVEEFWGPALQDEADVVVSVPHPIVYTFSREVFQRFRGTAASHAQRQIELLTGPPDATIQLKDVVPIQNQYVGLGSAHAISNVAAILAVRKKKYSIKFGGSISFQDIRHGPAVLVGAYANRWTLQLTDDLRFVLADREGAPEIEDRKTGKRWALKGLQPNGRTPEDYVIVSRLFHPKTGKIVIALAGVTQYGTQTAGEFVTDEFLLEEGLKGAPADWKKMNAQFLLHVPVLEGVPGKPEVVERHFW